MSLLGLCRGMLPGLAGLAVACLAALSSAQSSPRVIALEPANESCEVDAATTTKLVARFDQDMDTSGWSLIGGGETFPKVTGGPRWRDARTLEIDVELRPGQPYRMALNNARAQRFRSKAGLALPSTSWIFDTLADPRPAAEEQRERNVRALREARAAIDTLYSYRDLRIANWDALWTDREPELLARASDLAFAQQLSRALAPTRDVHVYLRHGERIFAVHVRETPSDFDFAAVQKLLDPKPIGKRAAVARTQDRIGYLLISTWTSDLDLSAVETALDGLMGMRAIILDVRPNSGGNEILARQVASRFVATRADYSFHRTRDTNAESGFGPIQARSIEPHSEPQKRYTGKLVVLIGPTVMSSNESFVRMLQHAGDCTLVGRRTFGSSGNPKPAELSNGTILVLPSWQEVTADGTVIEGLGVEPDIAVAADAIATPTSDPVLERALELLRD
ncbi:MAG: S41 family peptidase [Planctomycetota bacterium]